MISIRVRVWTASRSYASLVLAAPMFSPLASHSSYDQLVSTVVLCFSTFIVYHVLVMTLRISLLHVSVLLMITDDSVNTVTPVQ